MPYGWEFWTMLAGLLTLALVYDIRDRRIPNWLVLAGLSGGIACSLFSFQGAGAGTSASHLVFAGPGAVGQSLLGALAGLAMLLPLYLLRTMGAGDVKLMAAIGAFLGPLQVAGAALLACVAGGVLSLLAAIGSRSLPRVLGNLRMMLLVATAGRGTGLSMGDVQTTGRLPYAIAIAVGTVLQLWLASRGGWLFA